MVKNLAKVLKILPHSFFLVVSLFVICVVAEDNITPTTIPSILQNEGIVSMVHWDAGGSNNDLLCVVTEKRDNADEMMLSRVMTIYKRKGSELIKVYEFLTPDSLLSMYALGESGGRFFTAWVGGSAYHFYVFANINNKIIKVLEMSSKIMPEFAWDKDSNEIILITHLTWVKNKKTSGDIQVPDTTEVFRWDSKKYKMVKTIPWGSRFKWLHGIR